jgi:hypothetical protein
MGTNISEETAALIFNVEVSEIQSRRWYDDLRLGMNNIIVLM